MLFSKKQQNDQLPQEGAEQPATKNAIARRVDNAKQKLTATTQSVKQKIGVATQTVKDKAVNVKQSVKKTVDDTKQSLENQMQRFRKVQLVFSVIATLFFVANSLFWVFNKWGDFGNLLWVMLAITVAYVLVFVISLFKYKSSGKQMNIATKRFKVHMNIWRTLADLLFLALSGVTLYQNLLVWRAEGGAGLLISTIVSGLLIFIKLLLALIKVAKLNKQRKKLNKTQQKLSQTQQLAEAQE